MKLIYIAGPYSNHNESGVFDNIMRARAKAFELWKAGYAAICPHMNTAFMGLTYEEVIPGDLEMLSRCDAIYLLKGWRQSKGAVREWKRAAARGLDIYEECHREPPEEWYVTAAEASC